MAIQAMNIAIKNNNAMRSRRYKFKRTFGGYDKTKITEYDLPEATTKQLTEIRKRLEEERKVRMLKVVLLTVILFVGLVFTLVYLTNGMVELLTY